MIIDSFSSNIQVTYYSRCGQDGPIRQTNKCTGLRVGMRVQFKANIKVLECPIDPLERKQTIKINAVGIADSKLIIDFRFACCYTEMNELCKFPFFYKGKKFNSCMPPTWEEVIQGEIRSRCQTINGNWQYCGSGTHCQTDEDSDGNLEVWWIPAIVVAIIQLSLICANYIYTLTHEKHMKRRTPSDGVFEMTNQELDHPQLPCDPQELLNKLDKLMLSLKAKKSKIECRQIYQKILLANGGDTHLANMFLFKNVGTSKGMSYLLGHYDGDLGSKWEIFTKTFCITKLWYWMTNIKAIGIIIGFLIMLLRSWYYLIDMIKDVRFIQILFQLLPKPIHLIVTAITSLVTSELFKMVHLLSGPGATKCKLAQSIFSPLMIIYANHREFILERQLHKIAFKKCRSEEDERKQTQIRNELQENAFVKSELRGVENVLEHFLQVIISLSLLNLPNWGMTKMDSFFVQLSACVSALSIVNGQIMVLSTCKKGQLGFKAKILMMPYLAAAGLPRGYLFFACLRCATTYDYAPLFVTAGTVILHVILSYVIQIKLFHVEEKGLIHALWSVLAPPLFLDWDWLFRKQEYAMSVRQCWMQTKRVFLLHNLVSFMGNMAIAISIVATKGPMMVTDNTFLLIFIPTTVSPAILIGLGYIYFTQCHPWARILKVELAKVQEDFKNADIRNEHEEEARHKRMSEPCSSTLNRKQLYQDTKDKYHTF